MYGIYTLPQDMWMSGTDKCFEIFLIRLPKNKVDNEFKKDRLRVNALVSVFVIAGIVMNLISIAVLICFHD